VKNRQTKQKKQKQDMEKKCKNSLNGKIFALLFRFIKSSKVYISFAWFESPKGNCKKIAKIGMVFYGIMAA